MTLIISCVTQNHVVQVSDRRLTWITGPNAGQVADDNKNKAVIVCNRLAIGYTGLAEIAGSKTDEWLLDVVREVLPYNPLQISKAIAKSATKDFRKILLPSDKKTHTFLVSGWAKFSTQDTRLTPFNSFISNTLDDRGEWTSQARDTFVILTIHLADLPFELQMVGRPVKPKLLNDLTRQIRNYVERERGSEGYIQMLASAIRTMSKSDPLIGRNLMAVSLPRVALEQNIGVAIPLALPLPRDAVTALYLPESGDGSVLYAPHYTCEGISYKGMIVNIDSH